jgi:hypothetical protein
VEQDAWLIACDLAETQDVAAYLASPEHQEMLLRYLYQHVVRYRERKIRHAIRLDQDREEGPDKYDLLSNSSARDIPDPLAALIARESERLQDDEPSPHGSVAGAYAYLLRNYGDNMRALADYLLISVSYCYRCYARAGQLARSQHSIFCGATHDDKTVLPPRRWRNYRVQRAALQPTSDLHERARLLL